MILPKWEYHMLKSLFFTIFIPSFIRSSFIPFFIVCTSPITPQSDDYLATAKHL